MPVSAIVFVVLVVDVVGDTKLEDDRRKLVKQVWHQQSEVAEVLVEEVGALAFSKDSPTTR